MSYSFGQASEHLGVIKGITNVFDYCVSGRTVHSNLAGLKCKMPGITGVYDGPKQKLNTYLLNTLLETRVHSGFVEESTQIPTFP